MLVKRTAEAIVTAAMQTSAIPALPASFAAAGSDSRATRVRSLHTP
jgi:hypothetical protein